MSKKEEKNLPAVIDYSQEAGAGFQNLTVNDTGIPYITILQSLSPQVKKGEAHIEGAEEGDIFNTVTQEVIAGKDGIKVIPCAYEMKWTEWKSRESGGGFVSQHPSADVMVNCHKNSKGVDELPNGNVIIPTAYYYVLIVKEDGTQEKAILPMARTQLKKSRRWLSVMQAKKMTGTKGLYTPPMFSHTYHLTTIGEAKDKFSWFGWTIDEGKLIDSANLFALVKQFNIEVSRGAVKSLPPVEASAEGNI